MAKAMSKQKKANASPKGSSTELVLLGKLINGEGYSERQFLLPDLIYTLASETKKYAYKSGTALGMLAAVHFKGINSLEKILEAAGFGKVVYYPFESEVIITSARSHSSFAFETNVHYFEAGLIAGFLSKSTGTKIECKESHCRFNNSSFCQFVASPTIDPYLDISSSEDIDKSAQSLLEAVNHFHVSGSKPDEAYYYLLVSPLLREPLLTASSKVLYNIGQSLANISKPEMELEKLFKFLQIRGSQARNNKPNKLILHYSISNSHSGYVLLTSSLLQGYLEGAYNSRSTLSKRLVHGAYVVEIRLE